MRLTPNPEAALTARRCLDRLGTVLPSEKLEDVRLVVSELVTNSVRHAGLSPDEQISLTVVISDGSVRGRVSEAEDRLEWWVGPAHPGENLRSLGCGAQRLRVRLVRDRLRYHSLSSW
jgi:anti-sigma regulatory factor (Ser/Thr protein kinase)